MSKMGSHDPFGYSKHKLWQKEGPKIKLSIWFLTTKSWKSPRCPCVEVTCQISLKSFWRRLQLYFKPHLNQSFAHKVMGFQSCESPNFGNFGTPNLRVPRQNDIWVLASWPCTKNTIKGKVVASPKSEPWWVLWVYVCPWLVVAPKVFQLCTNQLIVWFVQVYVSNWLAYQSS
jgi:hypothetical protein